MPALCNDPDRCEVINLGWATAGRGPYLVRQHGYTTNSHDFQPQPFILQKDGRWLLNLAFVMLSESQQEQQLFHSLTDVLHCFERIANQPVQAEDNLPTDANPAEILRNFESCTLRILQGLRTGKVMPIN